MKIKIDLIYWFGIIKFIMVASVLIILASNYEWFPQLFQEIDPQLSGILLWVIFLLYALNFLRIPKKREDHNEKE